MKVKINEVTYSDVTIEKKGPTSVDGCLIAYDGKLLNHAEEVEEVVEETK